MTKYSYEFKLKVVQAYLIGEGSYDYLAKNTIYLYAASSKNGLRHTRCSSDHYLLIIIK